MSNLVKNSDCCFSHDMALFLLFREEYFLEDIAREIVVASLDVERVYKVYRSAGYPADLRLWTHHKNISV